MVVVRSRVTALRVLVHPISALRRSYWEHTSQAPTIVSPSRDDSPARDEFPITSPSEMNALDPRMVLSPRAHNHLFGCFDTPVE